MRTKMSRIPNTGKNYPLIPHTSEEYREWARYYLWRKFPDVQHVDTALQRSNGHLLPAFKQLTAAQAAAAGKKGKHCFGFGSTWIGSNCFSWIRIRLPRN
jgi:hypothetical protein